MNDSTSATSEVTQTLGRRFLLSCYLPALAFVWVHILVLLPIWRGAKPGFLVTDAASGLLSVQVPALSVLAQVLLLAFVVAVAILALNGIVVRLFEGQFKWIKNGVLLPLTAINRWRSRRRYGRLVGFQTEYRRVSSLYLRSDNTERLAIQQQLAGLAKQIDSEHRNVEKKERRQSLPHDQERIMPTAFGNAYAVAEEYVYERYGIDAVLFWPRLRVLMAADAPSQSEGLSGQKSLLDLSLNLALGSGLIALESLITMLWSPTGHSSLLISLAAIGAVLYACFYSASVSSARLFGELIRVSFDFHRHLLLGAYGLALPGELLAEQLLWLRLAMFVRRGDEFYLTEAKKLGASNETSLND